MPFPWAAAAMGAGSLLGFFGQRDTNKMSAREAQKNRDFQERMSNTAIQRRMADMKAGGINPILAAKFDATTPSGAMANFGNPGLAGAQAGSLLGNTALGAQKINAEIATIESRTNLNNQQAQAIAFIGALSTKAEEGIGIIIDYLENDAATDIQGFLNTIPGEIRNAVNEVIEGLKHDVNKVGTDTGDWFRQMDKKFQNAWDDLFRFIEEDRASRRLQNKEL